MPKRRAPRGGYRMTPARRAALRKAQLASARKRKRNKLIRRTAVGVGAVAVVGAGAYGRHKLSGSEFRTRPSSKGSRVYKVGGTVGVGRVVYSHKKLNTAVLGKKIAGAPRSVIGHRPPNAIRRRRLDRYNFPHGEDAKSASRIHHAHTTGVKHDLGVRKPAPRPKKPKANKGRTGGNYSRSFGMGRTNYSTPGVIKPVAGIPKHSRGTKTNRDARRISSFEAGLRTRSYMESLPKRRQTTRRRNQALKYYASQPLYSGTGTPGRRGRQRSRELKRRKK